MVVVAAQSKPKTGGYELQLPSMGSLTSKTSSQAFFLRILKVILQLRDAARLAAAKAKKKQSEISAASGSAGAVPVAGTSSSSVPNSQSDASTPGPMETTIDTSASGGLIEATAGTEVPAPMEVCIVFFCFVFLFIFYEITN